MTMQRRAITLTLLLAPLIVVARAGADVCSDKFGPVSGGIQDSETGLIWKAGTGGPSDWPTAAGNCSGVWRLPTALELQTIVDDSTANFPPPHFATVNPPQAFWSSSPPGNSPSNDKFFVVSNGAVGRDPKTIKHRYRCVLK